MYVNFVGHTRHTGEPPFIRLLFNFLIFFSGRVWCGGGGGAVDMASFPVMRGIRLFPQLTHIVRAWLVLLAKVDDVYVPPQALVEKTLPFFSFVELLLDGGWVLRTQPSLGESWRDKKASWVIVVALARAWPWFSGYLVSTVALEKKFVTVNSISWRPFIEAEL